MPETVRTEFAGNAQWLAESLASQPLLIGAAFLAIYIVLGVLYESLTQPLTIISTLPSAGLGALLALLVDRHRSVDHGHHRHPAADGDREEERHHAGRFRAGGRNAQHGRTPLEAIHAACLERFRPIIMTTLAALFGAVPLAVGFGTGAELRQPLGIAIIGGLIVVQALTLYTTPVVYLALQPRRRRQLPAPLPAASGSATAN